MPKQKDPTVAVELLRAAEGVFVERGFASAKVEEITARAGVSKGAFYLHFDSKEDAFRRIVEARFAKMADLVESELTAPPRGLDELPEAWLAKDLEIFEFVWENRALFRMCLEGGASADFAYVVDAFAERIRGTVLGLLRRGVEMGLYRRDLDLELTALVMAGAYDRVARALVRAVNKPDLPAMLAEVQRLLVRSIATPDLLAIVDPPVTHRRPSKRPSRRKTG